MCIIIKRIFDGHTSCGEGRDGFYTPVGASITAATIFVSVASFKPGKGGGGGGIVDRPISTQSLHNRKTPSPILSNNIRQKTGQSLFVFSLSLSLPLSIPTSLSPLSHYRSYYLSPLSHYLSLSSLILCNMCARRMKDHIGLPPLSSYGRKLN